MNLFACLHKIQYKVCIDMFLKKNMYTYKYYILYVGPNNLWARPTCSWGVQRPKPKKVMARAQKYKAKNGPEMQPRTV